MVSHQRGSGTGPLPAKLKIKAGYVAQHILSSEHIFLGGTLGNTRVFKGLYDCRILDISIFTRCPFLPAYLTL